LYGKSTTFFEVGSAIYTYNISKSSTHGPEHLTRF